MAPTVRGCPSPGEQVSSCVRGRRSPPDFLQASRAHANLLETSTENESGAWAATAGEQLLQGVSARYRVCNHAYVFFFRRGWERGLLPDGHACSFAGAGAPRAYRRENRTDWHSPAWARRVYRDRAPAAVRVCGLFQLETQSGLSATGYSFRREMEAGSISILLPVSVLRSLQQLQHSPAASLFLPCAKSREKAMVMMIISVGRRKTTTRCELVCDAARRGRVPLPALPPPRASHWQRVLLSFIVFHICSCISSLLLHSC